MSLKEKKENAKTFWEKNGNKIIYATLLSTTIVSSGFAIAEYFTIRKNKGIELALNDTISEDARRLGASEMLHEIVESGEKGLPLCYNSVLNDKQYRYTFFAKPNENK